MAGGFRFNGSVSVIRWQGRHFDRHRLPRPPPVFARPAWCQAIGLTGQLLGRAGVPADLAGDTGGADRLLTVWTSHAILTFLNIVVRHLIPFSSVAIWYPSSSISTLVISIQVSGQYDPCGYWQTTTTPGTRTTSPTFSRVIMHLPFWPCGRR